MLATTRIKMEVDYPDIEIYPARTHILPDGAEYDDYRDEDATSFEIVHITEDFDGRLESFLS
jgi:hypothetical protein